MSNTLLFIAAFLAVAIGIAHSVLGELYLLIPLFRHDHFPKFLGSTEFATRTLRFAWHITTIAWLGFAAILVQLALGSISASGVALVVGITFVSTGIVTFAVSRAKHLAWPVFLVIGCVALYVAAA